jgi:hypothetical protein
MKENMKETTDKSNNSDEGGCLKMLWTSLLPLIAPIAETINEKLKSELRMDEGLRQKIRMTQEEDSSRERRANIEKTILDTEQKRRFGIPDADKVHRTLQLEALTLRRRAARDPESSTSKEDVAEAKVIEDFLSRNAEKAAVPEESAMTKRATPKK